MSTLTWLTSFLSCIRNVTRSFKPSLLYWLLSNRIESTQQHYYTSNPPLPSPPPSSSSSPFSSSSSSSSGSPSLSSPLPPHLPQANRRPEVVRNKLPSTPHLTAATVSLVEMGWGEFLEAGPKQFLSTAYTIFVHTTTQTGPFSYTHTYIHTYIHTHTHTLVSVQH